MFAKIRQNYRKTMHISRDLLSLKGHFGPLFHQANTTNIGNTQMRPTKNPAYTWVSVCAFNFNLDHALNPEIIILTIKNQLKTDRCLNKVRKTNKATKPPLAMACELTFILILMSTFSTTQTTVDKRNTRGIPYTS